MVLDLVVQLMGDKHVPRIEVFSDEDAETLFTQGASSLRSLSFTVCFLCSFYTLLYCAATQLLTGLRI